jgi:carbamoyl-phosphate synthase large subunit
VAKVSEDVPRGVRSVVELIRDGEVDLVINTPFGRGTRTDGYFIRTAAAQAGIPCITTLPGAFAAVRGIEALGGEPGEPVPLQLHHARAAAPAPVQTQLGVATSPVG